MGEEKILFSNSDWILTVPQSAVPFNFQFICINRWNELGNQKKNRYCFIAAWCLVAGQLLLLFFCDHHGKSPQTPLFYVCDAFNWSFSWPWIWVIARCYSPESEIRFLRLHSACHVLIKDIPAQWAKIRQGLDIFRVSSKCVCLSNGEV